MTAQAHNGGGTGNPVPGAMNPGEAGGANGAEATPAARGVGDASKGGHEGAAEGAAAEVLDGLAAAQGGHAVRAALIPALIRSAADGELSPEGGAADAAAIARLEQLLGDATAAQAAGVPGAAQRIEFERALRSACGRCMGTMAGTPSDSFRARVEAAVREADMTGPGTGVADRLLAGAAGASHIHQPVDRAREAGRPEPGRAPAGARRASRTRRLAMSLGASALLLFAGAAVYQAVINAGAASNDPAAFPTQVASFVTTEHRRTPADSDAARDKFECTQADRVCDVFRSVLGESPALPPVGGEHGLTFQGAGACHVPGGEPSIHVRYASANEGHEGGHVPHEMSLFVQRDGGRFDLEEGRVYTLECERGHVEVWRKGALIYFLVSDEAGDCDCFREAAGLGEPSGVARLKRR